MSSYGARVVYHSGSKFLVITLSAEMLAWGWEAFYVVDRACRANSMNPVELRAVRAYALTDGGLRTTFEVVRNVGP